MLHCFTRLHLICLDKTCVILLDLGIHHSIIMTDKGAVEVAWFTTAAQTLNVRHFFKHKERPCFSLGRRSLSCVL